MKKILVFTDLDGTLLNHYNYSWHDAIPALDVLKENNVPLIFTSSKTAAEQIKLKLAIGNPHPFVCENGAIANVPAGYFESNTNHDVITTFNPIFFATPYQEILTILAEVRERYQYRFRGFHDMEVDELVALTNLSYEQAIDSKQRQASEPFIWKDSDEAFTAFKGHLEERGLIVTSGGRFYHVMSDVNKGQTIKWLIDQFKTSQPNVQWLTIGLGDSYNDQQMLEVVDYPVLIRNPGSEQPDMSYIENLTVTQLAGAEGWNNAILELLRKNIEGISNE